MLTEIDLQIIRLLRSNARQSLASIAREVGIPPSTLFDKVRAYERKFVHKHTTLLDFDKLGFFTKTQIAVKASSEKKQQLQEYLSQHKNVNSLYKINRGFDFLLDCIFKSPAEAKNFIDQLQKTFNLEKTCIFDVLEDIKREEFLPCLYHSPLA